MPCPTCDHTLENVGITGNGGTCFLCPRCGTFLQYFSIGSPERHVYVPKLVERCREFEKLIPTIDTGERDAIHAWTTEGIAKSIRKPEDRT